MKLGSDDGDGDGQTEQEEPWLEPNVVAERSHLGPGGLLSGAADSKDGETEELQLDGSGCVGGKAGDVDSGETKGGSNAPAWFMIKMAEKNQPKCTSFCGHFLREGLMNGVEIGSCRADNIVCSKRSESHTS